MQTLAYVLGWVIVPALILGLSLYLRKHEARRGRMAIILAGLGGWTLAFTLGVSDGASVASSMIAGAVFGIGAMVFAALLLGVSRWHGGGIPW